MPTLSILICHLKSRAHYLQRLQRVLQPQVFAAQGRVEVIISTDDGRMSVGTKRNQLVQKATGDFVAFIDDDDVVSQDYIMRILQAVDKDPTIDCVGLEGVITFQGPLKMKPRKFIHSRQYTDWYTKDKVFYRSPNHLNPVARKHAIQAAFPDKDVGEDYDWSMLIKPFLHKEIMLDGPIYFYESRHMGHDIE